MINAWLVVYLTFNIIPKRKEELLKFYDVYGLSYGYIGPGKSGCLGYALGIRFFIPTTNRSGVVLVNSKLQGTCTLLCSFYYSRFMFVMKTTLFKLYSTAPVKLDLVCLQRGDLVIEPCNHLLSVPVR
jgi:hypothetical protein